MIDQVEKSKYTKYIKMNKLNVGIEIDGGINFDTGKICVKAGANILVAGSFYLIKVILINNKYII